MIKHFQQSQIEQFLKILKNLWLFGKAGIGKSQIIKNIAKELQIPCYTFNCGIGTTYDELCGYINIQNTITEGPLWTHFNEKCIILLDEIDLLDNKIQNQLNSAIQDGELHIMNQTKKRHPECFIVGTANTNGIDYDNNHNTRQQSDISLLSRFCRLKIEQDEEMELEILMATELSKDEIKIANEPNDHYIANYDDPTNTKLITNYVNIKNRAEKILNLIWTISNFCEESNIKNTFTFRLAKQIMHITNDRDDRHDIIDNWISEIESHWYDTMLNNKCFQALLEFLEIRPTDEPDFNDKKKEYQEKKTISSIQSQQSKNDNNKENGINNKHNTINDKDSDWYDLLGDNE